MRNETQVSQSVKEQTTSHTETTGRPAYVTPRLERLGGWSALTLQQSVPIFP